MGLVSDRSSILLGSTIMKLKDWCTLSVFFCFFRVFLVQKVNILKLFVIWLISLVWSGVSFYIFCSRWRNKNLLIWETWIKFFCYLVELIKKNDKFNKHIKNLESSLLLVYNDNGWRNNEKEEWSNRVFISYISIRFVIY